MLKLMKYELRKTAFSKLVLLVIHSSCRNCIFNRCILEKDNILAMGIIFLVMCTIFGVIYIGIESVNVLHRDLNTQTELYVISHTKEQLSDSGTRSWKMEFPLSWPGAFFCSAGSH